MTVMRRELDVPHSLGTSRRRALLVISAVTLGCLGLLGDLLLVGHTRGEEIWGVATALIGALVGVLSLAFLIRRSRNRVARIGLVALWLTVAFFGFGGYNSHRLPLPDGMSEERPRPPLAPLIFTGFGIAGALAVRSGSKGE
jgi:peptidoglycan/LPS O-acetylase OafA/YrhL